jgi:hypothetical protein
MYAFLKLRIFNTRLIAQLCASARGRLWIDNDMAESDPPACLPAYVE